MGLKGTKERGQEVSREVSHSTGEPVQKTGRRRAGSELGAGGRGSV